MNFNNEEQEHKKNKPIISILQNYSKLKVFLENNNDPNELLFQGITPIMLAVDEGTFKIINLLLQFKADPNIMDDYKNNAINYSYNIKDQNVIPLLSIFNTNINNKTIEGRTALIDATRMKNKNTVETLLNNNANTNIQDKSGWTALTYASFHGYNDIVKILLKKNTNINLKSKTGKTALNYAKDKKNKKIIRILNKYIIIQGLKFANIYNLIPDELIKLIVIFIC